MNSNKGLSLSHCKEYGLASKNRYYYSYKNAAKRRLIDFKLIFYDFIKITSSSCYYCGCSPSKEVVNQKNCNGSYICNGIDRLDPKVGYVLENCVPCCSKCNFAKLSMTKNEFFAWVKSVYEYSTSTTRTVI